MRQTIIAAAVTALVAIVPSVSPASSTGESALRGPFLGSYTAALSVEQAAARGDSRMAGNFKLVLRRNGTYVASNPLDGRSSGRLASLPGRRLRFYTDRGCIIGGFERPQGGIYRWSLNGRRLTLRLVSEGPCSGRTQTLTYPVWKRR